MNAPFKPTAALPDIDSRDRVEQFVRSFYARLLQDEVLAPIFLDVAEVDLEVHLPHIIDYWCKLLLGDPSYQRHTMNIHRRLNHKRQLTEADFARWLGFFEASVDAGWRGPNAARARRIAANIAANMRKAFS